MLRTGPQVTTLALCVASSIVLSVEQASAADWQMTPSAYVASSYADNPRLRARGGDSTSGGVGEISGVFKRLTDRSEFSLRPRLSSSHYNDDSLSSDDQYLTASYRHLNERSEWNMDLNYTRDSTLTSELGETGLIDSNRRRIATNVSVSPKVMFTERLSGGLQLSRLVNRYMDAEYLGLVDYRYSSLSMFTSMMLTDAGSSLSLTAQVGELISDGRFNSNTDDGSLRLGWSFRPWQSWSASVSAGPSYAKTDFSSDTGRVFDADIRRQAERWAVSAAVARMQSPTGRGVLTKRDRASLSLQRSITENINTTLAAQWVRNEDVSTQRGGRSYKVDYARLDLTTSWRVASQWSLTLLLSASTQDYETAPERAEGYRAMMSMVWNGQPQSL